MSSTKSKKGSMKVFVAIMIPKAPMVLIMIPDKDDDKEYDEHK